MWIAFTSAPGRGATDRLLAGLAETLADDGLRCVGVVQENRERQDGRAPDMDLRLLPDGERLRISRLLSPGASGCRLDADALERSVARVGQVLAAGGDLLIINKFGEREAAGGGFREVIGAALVQDIPVLVGVNGSGATEFGAFADGLATKLPPDPEALRAWALSARDRRNAAASA